MSRPYSTYVIRDVSYETPFSWFPSRRQEDGFGRRIDSIQQPEPKLDIYLPAWGESYGELSVVNPDLTSIASTAAPRKLRKVPVVVVVHGGGWHRGGRNVEWRGAPPISRALAPHGFITVAVSYRLSSALAISILVRCVFVALFLSGLVKLITFGFAPGLQFWKIFLVALGATILATLAFKSKQKVSPAKHPDHVNDVARAITWVRHNISSVFPQPPSSFATEDVTSQEPPTAVYTNPNDAEILVADPNAIYLVGHSAGAHLVSLAAIDPQYLIQADTEYRSKFPDALFESQSLLSNENVSQEISVEEKSNSRPVSPSSARDGYAESPGRALDISDIKLPQPEVSEQIDNASISTKVKAPSLLKLETSTDELKQISQPQHFSTPLSPLSPGTNFANGHYIDTVHRVVDGTEAAREIEENKGQRQIGARNASYITMGDAETATLVEPSEHPHSHVSSLLPFPIRGVIPISGIYDLIRPLRPFRYHPMNFFFHIFYTYSAFGFTDKSKKGASPLHKLLELFPDGVYDALPPFTVLSATSDFGLELGAQDFVKELQNKHAQVSYSVINQTNHASIVSKFTSYDAYRTVLSSLKDGNATTVTIKAETETTVLKTNDTTIHTKTETIQRQTTTVVKHDQEGNLLIK